MKKLLLSILFTLSLLGQSIVPLPDSIPIKNIPGATNANFALTVVFRGAWSSSATYLINEMVTYNGASYIAIVSTNTNHQPDISSTQWSPFAAQGPQGIPGSTPSGTDAQLLGFPGGTATAVTPLFIGTPIQVYLPAATLTTVEQYAIASQFTVGTYTDIFTCPSQTPQIRCAVQSVFFMIGGSSNQTCSVALKDTSANYHLISITSIQQPQGTFATFPGIILEQGEGFSTNCQSVAYNVIAPVIEFNNTAPLKSVWFSNFSTGNNTVYTAPSGKHTIFESSLGLSPSTAGATTQANPFAAHTMTNITGSSVQLNSYMVPSGQTVSTTYATSQYNGAANFITYATNTMQVLKAPFILNSGDSIVIGTNQGPNGPSGTVFGQTWYATIIEQ